jgi:hypothetical protein
MYNTINLFVMVQECTPKTNEAEAVAFLESIGAVETDVQVAEERWWFGRYDKEQKLYQVKNETSIE